jgi:hypothetical protein
MPLLESIFESLRELPTAKFHEGRAGKVPSGWLRLADIAAQAISS